MDALQRLESRVRDASVHELIDPRVADTAGFRNAPPVAFSLIQQGSDFDIKISAHGAIIAKICGTGKQQIAGLLSQDIAMQKKSLNQVLAETLNKLMEQRDLSNVRLGRTAGVAPNTIAKYRRFTGDQFTASKGKESSATLANIESIARALGVDPLYLLTDPVEQMRKAEAVARAMMAVPVETSLESKQHPLAA